MSASLAAVFIPHEEYVWVSGYIVENSNRNDIKINIDDEDLPNEVNTKSISLDRFGIPSLPPRNVDIPVHGVDDMTKLNYLHEPAILDNLKRRFKNSQPYTYTGEVCIAVNPYKWLNHFYTDELQASYSKKTRHELSPHVYATSTDAYRGLTVKGKNQSILVTGESGAGKTETVKILMNHLAFIASRTGDKTVDKLLKANPLLESFGNAKTSRNDNSSRFGKFSQLEFDDTYALVGSKCITYLLEKSRVVGQSSFDRNFHIMYQLLAAPEPVKQKLFLNGKTSSNFNYMKNGDTKTSVIEGKSDANHYLLTVEGLDVLGVGPILRGHMEEAIAGILHLGQVPFFPVGGNADTATIIAPVGGLVGWLGAQGTFDESTVACCKLLGVSTESFSNSVVSRQIEVEGKSLSVPLSVEQAASGRDALAKEIYNRIFQWLIYVINFNTCYACNSTSFGSCTTISLLDIFGFEQFAKNGFEQFCINYANEKLQQRFTHDVFMTVQKEYQEEGLPWEIIKYKDNQETLDMIEGRLSIVDLLNEECQIPKGTDSNFYSKIKQNFEKHFAFSTDPRSRDEFTVRHYAGLVTYTVTGFMDANKDAVPNNLISLLATSENRFLKRLFVDSPYFGSQAENEQLLSEEKDRIANVLLLNIDAGEFSDVSYTEISSAIPDSAPSSPRSPSSARSPSTPRGLTRQRSGGFVVSEKILTKFKNQLGSLMDMVNATDVQYVRCVKPNPNKSSVEYDRRMVVDQLRSAGMIEAVRISRAAFPNRLLYKDFIGRFHLIRPVSFRKAVLKDLSSADKTTQMKELTMAYLKDLIPNNKKALNDGTGTTEQYAFGHTKVYFSSYVLEALEAARIQIVLSKAIKLQKVARGLLARRRFKKALAAYRAELELKKKREEEARRVAQEKEEAVRRAALGLTSEPKPVVVKQAPPPEPKSMGSSNALVSHTRDGVDVPVLKTGSAEPTLLTDESNANYSPVTVEVDDSDGKMLIRIRKTYTRVK